jgi:hypothetical protein
VQKFERSPTVRQFFITTGPAVSDPAWVISCAEIVTVDGLNDVLQYEDFSVIKDLIRQCETKQIQIAAAMKEQNDLCELFGVRSYLKLIEIAKDYKERKA